MSSSFAIYFVFPYRGVGGVSVLFFRVANYLAKNNIAKPILIDFEDGTMSKLVQASHSNLEVLVYPKDDFIDIPGEAYVVFQSMTPWSIFPNIRLNEETRLLFWNCHPYNLVLFVPGLRFITYNFKVLNRAISRTILRGWARKLREFIITIHKKHGLVFMDEENRKNTQEYNALNLQNVELLPIPVEIDELARISTFRKESETIRITWVGRLVDFKYYPLKRLLTSVEAYAKAQSITFECSIIGSGPYLEALQKFASQLRWVKVKFQGDMELSQVRKFIDSKTDILAAMGTSALEGGAREVPTILLDLSYKDIPANYRFKWLHETTGCTLGEEISVKNCTDQSDSLGPLLARYNDDPIKVGKLCAEYVKMHHTLESVTSQLVESLEKSELQGKHLRGFLTNSNGGFSNRIYSAFRNLRTKIQGH